MTRRHPTALIVGAGLAGSLMACYLASAGWRVTVFERRPDPRRSGPAGGRSINLALSARGFWGLEGAGLADLVRGRDAIPMAGRMIHPPAGPPIFQPYSKNPSDANNSVSRAGLNLTLIEAAAARPGVELVFDHPCVDAEPAAAAATFRSPSGGLSRATGDLLVGADGAFSAVRAALQKTDRFEYSQSYLGHGYKELHIPPVRGTGTPGAGAAARAGPDAFALDPGALHIWPRGGAMMIALPNLDGSFTATLFWPFEGDHAFAALERPAPGVTPATETDRRRVAEFFAHHYADAAPLMPTLADDFFRNPTSSLVTVRCSPWHAGGSCVLIGDAAHAIVPFYGQGINAGFEDCRVLADCLADAGVAGGTPDGALAAALAEYHRRRKANADAIADMALENFVEMRDKTGRAEFRYAKRVEQALHALFGDAAAPQYHLVSFSTVPYTEARRRGLALASVVDAVVAALPASDAADMPDDRWADRVRDLATPLIPPAIPTSAPIPAVPRAAPRPDADCGPGPREQHCSIIDITPPVTPRLAVWPGDTPVTREVLCDLEAGSNITLSTLRATVHLGAHADGPNHYGRGAPGIGERSLAHYIGPCRVIDAPVARGSRVRVEDLAGGVGQIREPRVLIRTGTFPDPEAWNSDFAGLSVDLIDELARRGVITIGLDTPSVDVQDSKDLPAHHAMLRHDMAILEGLALAGVDPGVYELVALPLKLMGFDASPVRAVLRRLPHT